MKAFRNRLSMSVSLVVLTACVAAHALIQNYRH